MLSLPHSLTPRQPDAVWQAFHRCNLPPSNKDFIHRALWAKLPVGQCQQHWQPLEVWCPIDNELESISHAIFHCRFLVGAFEVVNTAFRSTGPHPFDVVHLLQDDKPASLETPAGLISWSAIITNWSLRCAKKHNSFFRITWESFYAKWFHTSNSWTSCPRDLPIPETVLAWFLEFLQRSSQPRPPPPTTAPKPSPPPSPFANTPPTPPPSKRQARNTARKLRKLQKAEELQEVLQDLSDSVIPLVYTDGSSAVEGHAGRLARYGIFCEKQTSIAAFVPDEYRQTNNSAELLAVIRALRIFSTGDIAICTDSQYVVLGATGAAHRWRLRGWIGSCGPVSNVPLWEQLLAALDENPRTVHWVKVPLHVTIEGNNEADRLADQGRQLHPRFPHPRTPSLLLSVAGTPRAPKKPKGER